MLCVEWYAHRSKAVWEQRRVMGKGRHEKGESREGWGDKLKVHCIPITVNLSNSKMNY